jgi:PAS domain S-box-containing protein
MNERATADSSELIFLRNRVAELESKTADLYRDYAHLKRLYERAPLAYQSLDEEGNFIEVNQAWLDILGYTREEVIGKNFAEFLHPDWRAHFDENFPRFKAVGEVLGVEFEMARKDGSFFLVSFDGRIGKDSHGRFQQTHCIFQDITERRRSEKELQESERLLNISQRLTKSGGWQWDVAKETMTWTEETYRIHDIDPREVGQGSPEHIALSKACYSPADQPKITTAFQRCVEFGEPYDLEFSFTTHKGRKLWIRTTAEAVWEVGRVVRVIGNIQDITERKRAEGSLKESEERFRTLASLAPVGIYITSPDGQCQYANPRWCEMAGLTQAEALGTGWVNGLHPDDRDMVYGNWQQMVESEGRWGFEYRFRTPAGKTTWVFGLAAPQRVGTGEIVRYIGVNTDITEKKQDEEAIKNTLAEKEVLLREVHHRVKNNLAAIIGLFNLQRQAMEDPQAETVMADLSARVKAMSLVHEKLYRSESLARINFQDYLQSLISHLRTSFGSPSIHCEINAFGVEMSLDLAVPCGMIINELIINALKYAFPKERPETVKRDQIILVTMTREEDNISLSVADNGVGLPQGFDLKTVKSLGLVLVRMLGQHQLGGSYEVDQTDGTRFNFTFSMRNGRRGHE